MKIDYSKLTNKELREMKKALRKQFHQPINRRMNGKPTADAFRKYGKPISDISFELMRRSNPELMEREYKLSHGSTEDSN